MKLWNHCAVVGSGLAAILGWGCNEDKAPVEAVEATEPPAQVQTNQEHAELDDGKIASKVRSSLQRDPGVNAEDIAVECTEGVAELSGTAHDLLTKRRAVRIAEQVRGVRAVSDRVELEVPNRSDSELAERVSNALLFDAVADSYEIDAAADRGVVTLTGHVQSYYERETAERVAEGVSGVREVKNELRVEYGVSRRDSEIKTDVESRLRWDALVNGGLIVVRVDDGKVTLDGNVASAAERRRAFSDAWVDGVRQVDNTGLEVSWWADAQDLTKNKFIDVKDDAVRDAIRDAAAYDPRVSTADLRVSVDDGVATLTGSVDSEQGRMAAEDLAAHTVGVLSVKNQLAVVPTRVVPDDMLQDRVESALQWDPYTEARAIVVAAHDGTVTLGGTVANAFERAEATQVAAGIRGVRDVNNNLAIEHTDIGYVYSPYFQPYAPYWESWHYPPTRTERSDADIQSAIESELYWSPFVDASRVKVEVIDGKATLTGKVQSWNERTAAIGDAYQGGALRVDNQLEVTK